MGTFDVVIDEAADRDGEWGRFVTSVPGVRRVATEPGLAAYRVPASPAPAPTLGAPLPIRGVTAFRHDPAVIVDGRHDTEWGDDPQRPSQWIVADLGEVRPVAAVRHGLGEYAPDFPRLLAIELSQDGSAWEEVWRGPTADRAFLAAVRAPREAVMTFTFDPRPARYLRLRPLATHQNMWRVAELTVYGAPR